MSVAKKPFQWQSYHRQKSDPSNLKSQLETLTNAIREIYDQNCSLLSYEQLYNIAYKLVLQKQGDILYDRVRESLCEHLKSTVTLLIDCHSEQFLGLLVKEWDIHCTAFKMTKDFLLYIDRSYCPRKKKPEIFDMALLCFREQVLYQPLLRERTRHLLLQTIHMEREGSIIDRNLLHDCLQMLMMLGIQPQQQIYPQHHTQQQQQPQYNQLDQQQQQQSMAITSHSTAIVYEQEFEGIFLTETEKFYALESKTCLHTFNMTCPEYMEKIEERFHQELIERVQGYLFADTEKKLKTILEAKLLVEHCETLIHLPMTGMFATIHSFHPQPGGGEYGAIESLNKFYMLFSKNNLCFEMICKSLGKYIVYLGQEILQYSPIHTVDHQAISLAIVGSGSSSSAGGSGSASASSSSQQAQGSHSHSSSNPTKDPTIFIQQLLALKEKCDLIIAYAFKQEKKCMKIVKDSFEFVMNRDHRTAQYLASYLDEFFRNVGNGNSGGDTAVATSSVSASATGPMAGAGVGRPGSVVGRLASASGGNHGQQDNSVDHQLDRIIILFQFLHDKDIFENYYKNALCKRLLSQKSANDDLEKLMIAKLKAECGYQYTSKLEGMFVDMNLSKTVMEEYKRSSQYQQGLLPKMEMEVTLLTTGYWPLQPVQTVKLTNQLKVACENFLSFYLEKNNGRKLVWYPLMSTVDIKANFPAGRKELAVSTYQACMLLLFNHPTKTTYTLDEIREMTMIPEQELRRHLLSLCTPKLKILQKSSKGKGIEMNDSFAFNSEFTSKLKKMKVPLIAVKEIQQMMMAEAAGGSKGSGGSSSSVNAAAGAGGGVGSSSSNVMNFYDEEGNGSSSSAGGGVGANDELMIGGIPANVEEDRRHMVEAAIVRIMKARKTLSHFDLIAETTKQLSNLFIPTPVFIKKRIESLIERDYLQRHVEDPRLYNYLA